MMISKITSDAVIRFLTAQGWTYRDVDDCYAHRNDFRAFPMITIRTNPLYALKCYAGFRQDEFEQAVAEITISELYALLAIRDAIIASKSMEIERLRFALAWGNAPPAPPAPNITQQHAPIGLGSAYR